MLPLKNVKILELGTHVAIPSCTRLLTDFGAKTIKIEKITGDPYRTFGDQYQTPTEPDYNPFFTFHNTNKHIISLDLKTKEGKSVFFTLLQQTDIFITNVRSSALERLEIDYNALKSQYPGLIYCHFSGLGEKGPDAHKAGFDTGAYWARSGGLQDSIPCGHPFPHPPQALGDMSAGAIMAYGILTAYIGRLQTGLGTLLSSSLYANALYYMASGIISAQPKYGKSFPQNPDQPENPFRHHYQCKDGYWIEIAVQNYNLKWPQLCSIFSLQDWQYNPRYMTEESARANHAVSEMVHRISHTMRTKTITEWIALFDSIDLSYEHINHFNDVPHDPQAWTNQMLSYVHFKNNEDVIFPNSPIQMSNYDKLSITPQNAIGSDTEAILSTYGYTQDQIKELEKKRIIR